MCFKVVFKPFLARSQNSQNFFIVLLALSYFLTYICYVII